MDWWRTLLDGSIGGIVGALGAFWSAVWVVKRQARSDHALAYEQHVNAEVAAILAALYEMQSSATLVVIMQTPLEAMQAIAKMQHLWDGAFMKAVALHNEQILDALEAIEFDLKPVGAALSDIQRMQRLEELADRISLQVIKATSVTANFAAYNSYHQHQEYMLTWRQKRKLRRQAKRPSISPHPQDETENPRSNQPS